MGSSMQLHSDPDYLLVLFSHEPAGCTGQSRVALLVSCHADSSSNVAMASADLESRR